MFCSQKIFKLIRRSGEFERKNKSLTIKKSNKEKAFFRVKSSSKEEFTEAADGVLPTTPGPDVIPSACHHLPRPQAELAAGTAFAQPPDWPAVQTAAGSTGGLPGPRTSERPGPEALAKLESNRESSHEHGTCLVESSVGTRAATATRLGCSARKDEDFTTQRAEEAPKEGQG